MQWILLVVDCFTSQSFQLSNNSVYFRLLCRLEVRCTRSTVGTSRQCPRFEKDSETNLPKFLRCKICSYRRYLKNKHKSIYVNCFCWLMFFSCRTAGHKPEIDGVSWFSCIKITKKWNWFPILLVIYSISCPNNIPFISRWIPMFNQPKG